MADDVCVLFALWGRMGNAHYSIIWTIWSLLFQYSILAQRIRSDNAGTKNNTKYLSVISGFDKFASSIHGSQSSQQRSVFNAFAVFQCPNNFFYDGLLSDDRRPITGRLSETKARYYLRSGIIWTSDNYRKLGFTENKKRLGETHTE